MNIEGILLLINNGQYYLQYDCGELVENIKNLPITLEEAKKILNSTDPAKSIYDVIIEYHNRGICGEDAVPFNND